MATTCQLIVLLEMSRKEREKDRRDGKELPRDNHRHTSSELNSGSLSKSTGQLMEMNSREMYLAQEGKNLYNLRRPAGCPMAGDKACPCVQTNTSQRNCPFLRPKKEKADPFTAMILAAQNKRNPKRNGHYNYLETHFHTGAMRELRNLFKTASRAKRISFAMLTQFSFFTQTPTREKARPRQDRQGVGSTSGNSQVTGSQVADGNVPASAVNQAKLELKKRLKELRISALMPGERNRHIKDKKMEKVTSYSGKGNQKDDDDKKEK